MAKKKIRDLGKPEKRSNPFEPYNPYNEYKSLFMNAVKIKGLDFNAERRVLSLLIEQGAVGYDKLTDRWATVFGEGLNELGDPTLLTFTFPNGKNFRRRAFYEASDVGAYRILATPSSFCIADMIKAEVYEETQCDIAINQNLLATKTPYIVVVKDNDTKLSVLQAIQQKENGEPVVVVSDTIGEGLKGVETLTPYLVDKFAAYRDMQRDKLFNKLGIMTANINKKERVQATEVNASVGKCIDYLYLIINTFNEQMTTYGLPFEMVSNAAIEELYTNDTNPEDEITMEGDIT